MDKNLLQANNYRPRDRSAIRSRGGGGVPAPAFSLPFLDAGSGAVNVTPGRGSGSATFTRAGATATTILSTGLISSAIAANTARSYYDPTTLQYLGYLAEEARTNLCIRSEEFDNAAWTKAGVTATANADVSPDGNTTADRLVETATGPGGHFASSTAGTITAGNTVTVSMFVKQGNLATCEMYLRNGASSRFAGQKFTFSGATIGAATVASVGYAVTSSGVQSFPNGWYRIWMVVTTVTDTSVIIDVYPKDATSYTGNTANYTSFWGVGMEVGAFATTYIPTAAAASTRAADVMTYSSAGNAITTAGTIFCRGAPISTTPIGGLAAVSDGSGNNTINLLISNSSIGGCRLQVNSGGGAQSDITVGTNTVLNIKRYAGTWASNNSNGFLDGVAGTLDTSVTVPASFTTINVGANAAAVLTNTVLRDLRIWQRVLSDSQIASIT